MGDPRLIHLLGNSKTGLILLDTEDKILFCNNAARSIIQCNGHMPPLEDCYIADIIENQSLLDVIQRQQNDDTRRLEWAHTDGRIFSVNLSHSEDIGYAITFQDATNYIEKDKQKTEIIELVSHQVRSPLTAILSYVEFLSRTGNLNPDQLEFSFQVKRNVQLITDTITDLLDISKIESGTDRQFHLLAIDPVLKYAINILRGTAEAKKQSLHYQASTKITSTLTLGNEVRLRQVFVNLIDNAIKYTPENGDITISALVEENQIIIQIVDSGIGIPREEQPHIFERFYRSSRVADNYEGTGLGLSIVKGIVEEHDGRIWVESSEGEGTIFTIVLASHPEDG